MIPCSAWDSLDVSVCDCVLWLVPVVAVGLSGLIAVWLAG